MTGRAAVYAGSFDPPTLGHLSVIERAAEVFDQVVVLIAVNPDKQIWFSVAERLEMLLEMTAHLANVRCDHTQGLVVERARTLGARFLVRGVRGATDAEPEGALAAANAALAPEVRTVWLPADPVLSAVSSSALKRMAAAGEDLAAFATARVAEALRARVGRRAPGEPLEVLPCR